MARPVRVYRLVVTLPEGADHHWKPEGWDDAAAEEHRHFAVWTQAGDGYTEPRETYFTHDSSDGRPWFRIPFRRHFLTRPAAELRAKGLREFGIEARVEESDPVTWSQTGGKSRDEPRLLNTPVDVVDVSDDEIRQLFSLPDYPTAEQVEKAMVWLSARIKESKEVEP